MTEHDPVNHPTHYASEATCSGCGESIEAIDVIRHLGFNIGNAMKYLWRAGKKDDIVQDLKKAVWYIQDQIAMLEGERNPNVHRLSKQYTNGVKIWNFPSNCIGADDERCLPVVDGTILHDISCPAKPEIAWTSQPPITLSREDVELGLATGKYIRESLVEELKAEGEKSRSILKCDWSDAAPQLGPASFQFFCMTHHFHMITAIDKAPERCDGAETTS